jgi:hypothetical protein
LVIGPWALLRGGFELSLARRRVLCSLSEDLATRPDRETFSQPYIHSTCPEISVFKVAEGRTPVRRWTERDLARI